MIPALTALWLSATPVPKTCAEIDARIEKRRHFLSVRRHEKLIFGPYAVSPFCEANREDEDCLPLSSFQDQRDISRDVSELVQEADAGPPDTDPVIVPLLRKRIELHCPGKPPAPARGEE